MDILDKTATLVIFVLLDLLAIMGIANTPRLASWFSRYVEKMRSGHKKSPLYYRPSRDLTESHYRRIYYFTFGIWATCLTYLLVHHAFQSLPLRR